MVCHVYTCLLVVPVQPPLSIYLNTLQGFITSEHFDVLLIAGDFNVDFDRSGPFHSLLIDFISDLNLFVCDLYTFQEFCWVHL